MCVCVEFVFVYRMSPLKGRLGSQHILCPQRMFGV